MPKFTNIQPSVNPKPLSVQRIDNAVNDSNERLGTLLIKNVQITPHEAVRVSIFRR